MKIKNIISLALTVTFLSSCFLTGCEKQPSTAIDDSNEVSVETEVSTDAEISDPIEEPNVTTEKEEEPEPEPEPAFYSPLSGLQCEEQDLAQRPVAMMINNLKQAIPQLGISNAEIIYECIVEGGITRLMAVFSDYKNLPTTGSVRSSRDYYIDLAQAHDAIYAHCGGSEEAYRTIADRRIDNIDGVRGSSLEASAYWKDKDRVRNMGYEHASMTSGEKLEKAVTEMNIRTDIADEFSHPLSFSEKDIIFEGNTANSLSITYSGNYAKSFFSYDEDTKEYKKGQYSTAHIDANTNTALSFKNVIVLGVSYKDTGDEYHHLVMNFTGSGKGYYVSNGKAKEIVWTKKDRQTPYKLFEADGTTPLLLNPGKSYIGFSNGLSTVKINENDEFELE